MANPLFRAAARADLRGIWWTSATTWSREQADRYLADLRRVSKRLATKPNLGRQRDDLREGLRVYPCGNHLIFYFPMDDGIDVVRVLHERMDIRSHL